MSPSFEQHPADRDFAAAAEQRRREGDARAAIALAEQGLAQHPTSRRSRIALALALLDAGEPGRAKSELERLLHSGGSHHAASGLGLARGLAEDAPRFPTEAAPTFERAVADQEIEDAFEDAETNPDEMMDANTVVEETLRGEAFDALNPFDVSDHPTYATQTMASLLEQQGRPDEASALRTSLGETNIPADSASSRERTAAEASGFTPEVADGSALERRRSLATLESWLRNLRRDGPTANPQRGAT